MRAIVDDGNVLFDDGKLMKCGGVDGLFDGKGKRDSCCGLMRMMKRRRIRGGVGDRYK